MTDNLDTHAESRCPGVSFERGSRAARLIYDGHVTHAFQSLRISIVDRLSPTDLMEYTDPETFYQPRSPLYGSRGRLRGHVAL
jgi:hypothetical protein